MADASETNVASNTDGGETEAIKESVDNRGSISCKSTPSMGSKRIQVASDKSSAPQPFPKQPEDRMDNHLKLDITNDELKTRVNNRFHYYRFLVVIFCGASVGLMCFLRYNITISILKMVNQTHLYLEEHPNSTVEDMIAEGYAPGGEFNWNNEIQQMVMSFYMISYTLPQMPMTKIATLIGCRWFAPLSLGLCAISTLLTPSFAYLGWHYILFLRLINGLGASPILPMLISLLENWLPDDEISLGLGISQSLTTTLVAANPLISGYLASIHWSLSFYIPGLIAVIFCIMWPFLINDHPRDNSLVSEQELKYIESGQSAKTNNSNSSEKTGDSDECKPSSCLALLRVPSFYALISLWCLHCSSFNVFNFVLPMYLIQFLRIEMTQNGLYCSIIQTGCILAVIWPHPFLKLLRNKFKFTDRASRRIVLGICCSIVAITWISVGFFHQHQLLLLFINRCTQNGVDVIITSTLMLNYARAGLSSLAFSAMNTVGNLSVVFSSTFIGWFLDYTAQSRAGWCAIFTSIGLMQLIIWIIYAAIMPTTPIKFRQSTNASNESARSQIDIPDRFVRRMSVLAQ